MTGSSAGTVQVTVPVISSNSFLSTVRVPKSPAQSETRAGTTIPPSVYVKSVYVVFSASVAGVVQVILPSFSSRVIPSQVERSTVLPASAATVYVVMTGSSAGTVQVTVPVISSNSFLSTVRVPKSPAQSETRAGTTIPPSVYVKSVYVVFSASVA